MRIRERFGGVPLLVAGVLLGSAGCGAHYWERPGAGVQEFQGDSQACIAEARAVQFGSGSEHIYRGCMRSRGWQRVKAGVAESNQFRGPEDSEDFAKPPSPTAGQGRDDNEAAIEAACRQPSASRSSGIVCPPRR